MLKIGKFLPSVASYKSVAYKKKCVPCSNVFRPLCDGASEIVDVVVGVHTDLQHVVEQSKERSQWEGRNEHSDEAVL